MGDVRWIKLYTALPDNRKIKQIRKLPNGDTIALMWVFLLCLAGDTNDQGLVYITKELPYTDEMLATAFDMDINTVRLGLQTFVRFGMIEVIDDILLLSNWEKYQSTDKLEKLREDNRKRVAAYRDRQKALAEGQCNVTVTLPVTECNAIEEEIEIEKDKDLIKEKNKREKRFTPPTIEEVRAFIQANDLMMVAEEFHDYYESKGWKVGNAPMKSWEAACRNWARREKKTPAKPTTSQNFINPHTEDEMDEFFRRSLERAKL